MPVPAPLFWAVHLLAAVGSALYIPWHSLTLWQYLGVWLVAVQCRVWLIGAVYHRGVAHRAFVWSSSALQVIAAVLGCTAWQVLSVASLLFLRFQTKLSCLELWVYMCVGWTSVLE